MAIFYKSIIRGIPGESKTTEGVKVAINDTITPSEFLDQFSEYSRIPSPVIVKMLLSMKAFLIDELKRGNIIQTGPLGSFYPSVKKDESDMSNGLTGSLYWRPDKSMKEEISQAVLKKRK